MCVCVDAREKIKGKTYTHGSLIWTLYAVLLLRVRASANNSKKKHTKLLLLLLSCFLFRSGHGRNKKILISTIRFYEVENVRNTILRYITFVTVLIPYRYRCG